jgi:hypothetical protein
LIWIFGAAIVHLSPAQFLLVTWYDAPLALLVVGMHLPEQQGVVGTTRSPRSPIANMCQQRPGLRSPRDTAPDSREG